MSAGSRERAERLALRGLRTLCASAEETTHGVRFRSNAAAIAAGSPAYPGHLYDGAAGVALALLEVAPLDRTGRALRLGREVVAGLIASSPPGPSNDITGLYLGLAGTALTLGRWAVATNNDGWKTEALRLIGLAGDRLPAASDLLDGVAGVGLGALALHRATGDASARTIVHRCVERLGALARPHGTGLAWPLGDDAPDGSAQANDLQTGFAHGTAGIATFLVAAAAALDDRTANELSSAAFRSLDHCARRSLGEAAWPVSDRVTAERYHWCHGTTGIALAYLARHDCTNEAAALSTAVEAGEHTWRSLCSSGRRPDDRTTGHCHGLGGALELFALLAEAAGHLWSERAEAVVRAIARRSPGRTPATFDGDGCGLAYGTAGVVRALSGWARGGSWPVWREFPERPAGPATVATADVRAAVSLNERRAPRSARVRLPRGFRLQDVFPVAAGALEGHAGALPVGPSQDEPVRRFAAAFLDTAAGSELRRAMAGVRRAAASLERRHADWLAGDGLGEAVFGSAVREWAALLLRPGDQPLAARRRTVRHLVERHVAGLARCLDDVARDRATHLAPLAEGRVTSVEHVGGDPHRGGAGVFGLNFADGRRVLHKPRSLRLDAFLAGALVGAAGESAARRVSSRLTPTSTGAAVPQHDIVDAGEWHGYVERVHGCRDPQGITDPLLRFLHPALGDPPPLETGRIATGGEPRFWYSAGLLAGHAACFGIGDLHGENLVYGTSRASPHPVLHAVDLEMAFTSPAGVGNAHLTPQFGHPVPVTRDAHVHFGLQGGHAGLCSMGAEEWCLLVTPDVVQATRRPNQLAGRHAPNAVRNSDGSFGYGGHLCAVVRGFTDYWLAIRPINRALARAARATLAGAVVRVLANASRAYVAPRQLRILGGPLWPGASWFAAHGEAAPLHEVERSQLDALDIPYLFQRLGEPGVRWMHEGAERVTPIVTDTVIADPFWSGIERFAGHEAFARGLGDLVAYGAPDGPFDQRDDARGARVCRAADDERLTLAVTTPEGPIRLRLELDGAVRWWEG